MTFSTFAYGKLSLNTALMPDMVTPDPNGLVILGDDNTKLFLTATDRGSPVFAVTSYGYVYQFDYQGLTPEGLIATKEGGVDIHSLVFIGLLGG